ncbi:DUF1345 domain-containing protein [Aeromicrobium endophyticum]|uniref:DUF1345 domain-containing protein n=2 Tax=Aeromicrobium endophyticum TaxID=2292704 RepID=A0A371NZH6_9ACTN|nr:DUF1345 domain-containing protein [Aeromicrobium endophyticum]
MLVVAVAVGSVVASWDTWELGLVVGWGAACLLYVSWVWLLIGRMDAASTAEHARREDPTRGVSDLLILVASVASLGAVALLLAEARGESDARTGALAATALAGVALSWLLVHTLFTLRYAAQYYEGDASAGDVRDIDFNTDEPPRFTDFAYVAFSVGMTFQISDTDLRTSRLRSLVLRHALLSYVFGTVVVATTINLAISLAG